MFPLASRQSLAHIVAVSAVLLVGSAFELKGKINIIASFLMKEWRMIAFGLLGWDIFYNGYVVCNFIKVRMCRHQQTVEFVDKMLLFCGLLTYWE